MLTAPNSTDPLTAPRLPAEPDDWTPSGVDAAFAMLDRISRYCEFSCAPGTERCTERACSAWNLEQAAVLYLAGRWLDVQD